MTDPVFIVDPLDLQPCLPGSIIEVSGDEGRHGSRARRLAVDERVDVVDGNGRRASGPVTDVRRDGFTVGIDQVVDEPAPTPRLVIVQALAKGDRAHAAVEMLTECGVDQIVPWAAERSVVLWRGDKATAGVDRWRSVARAATKQSRRSRIPTITDLQDTEQVSRMLAGARLALVLHEAAAARLSRIRLPDEGDVVVVVGPEGGLSPFEVGRLSGAGALPVRMGESVLRTSTAGVAAAAVLLAAAGRWD